MNSRISELYNIDEKIIKLGEAAEKNCAGVFAEIDSNAEYNGAKVLRAFSKNRISEPCFYGSTGYGYGDVGREAIDKGFVLSNLALAIGKFLLIISIKKSVYSLYQININNSSLFTKFIREKR